MYVDKFMVMYFKKGKYGGSQFTTNVMFGGCSLMKVGYQNLWKVNLEWAPISAAHYKKKKMQRRKRPFKCRVNKSDMESQKVAVSESKNKQV